MFPMDFDLSVRNMDSAEGSVARDDKVSCGMGRVSHTWGAEEQGEPLGDAWGEAIMV